MTRRSGRFELTLLANGTAELTRHGVQVWASDGDDEFADRVSDEFLDENDAESIFDYLVEEGHLTDREADNADFFVESQERTPDDPDDDEEEDDEEDDDDLDEEDEEEDHLERAARS